MEYDKRRIPEDEQKVSAIISPTLQMIIKPLIFPFRSFVYNHPAKMILIQSRKYVLEFYVKKSKHSYDTI